MERMHTIILVTIVFLSALLQIDGAATRRQKTEDENIFPYAPLMLDMPKNISSMEKLVMIKPPPPFSNSYWATLEAAEPGFDLTEDEIRKLKIWPNGIIPYYIDDFSFDKGFSEKLRKTLESANSITGLRFSELSKIPESDTERWVLFINRRGVLECEDYTTNSVTNEGVQRVIVGYDCLGGKGTLAATLLALLGVPPQHNAPDRDEYITVEYDNIMPEKRDLFKPLENNEWLFHNVKYDYHSAGHYDCHMYTVNGAATIKINKDDIRGDEERDCFSSDDIWKIRMLYNYMLRKRQKATAADCSKLFKPGEKFEQFAPFSSGEDVVPRNKPEQYLSKNTAKKLKHMSDPVVFNHINDTEDNTKNTETDAKSSDTDTNKKTNNENEYAPVSLSFASNSADKETDSTEKDANSEKQDTGKDTTNTDDKKNIPEENDAKEKVAESDTN